MWKNDGIEEHWYAVELSPESIDNHQIADPDFRSRRNVVVVQEEGESTDKTIYGLILSTSYVANTKDGPHMLQNIMRSTRDDMYHIIIRQNPDSIQFIGVVSKIDKKNTNILQDSLRK